MSWKVIRLARKRIAEGQGEQLRELFQEAVVANIGVTSAAMFATGRSVDDEVSFYFSPNAVSVFGEVLDQFGANTCNPPPRTGTSLLIGRNPEDWDLLSG